MQNDDQSNDLQQNTELMAQYRAEMFLSTGLSVEDTLDMADAMQRINAQQRLNKRLIPKAKALIADMLKHIEAQQPPTDQPLCNSITGTLAAGTVALSELRQELQEYVIALSHSLVVLTIAEVAAQKLDFIDNVDHLGRLIEFIDQHPDADKALEQVGLSSEAIVSMVELARTPKAQRIPTTHSGQEAAG